MVTFRTPCDWNVHSVKSFDTAALRVFVYVLPEDDFALRSSTNSSLRKSMEPRNVTRAELAFSWKELTREIPSSVPSKLSWPDFVVVCEVLEGMTREKPCGLEPSLCGADLPNSNGTV